MMAHVPGFSDGVTPLPFQIWIGYTLPANADLGTPSQDNLGIVEYVNYVSEEAGSPSMADVGFEFWADAEPSGSKKNLERFVYTSTTNGGKWWMGALTESTNGPLTPLRVVCQAGTRSPPPSPLPPSSPALPAGCDASKCDDHGRDCEAGGQEHKLCLDGYEPVELDDRFHPITFTCCLRSPSVPPFPPGPPLPPWLPPLPPQPPLPPLLPPSPPVPPSPPALPSCDPSKCADHGRNCVESINPRCYDGYIPVPDADDSSRFTCCLLSPPSPPPPPFAPPWEDVWFIHATMSWPEAHAKCTEYGGRLASVTSAEKQASHPLLQPSACHHSPRLSSSPTSHSPCRCRCLRRWPPRLFVRRGGRAGSARTRPRATACGAGYTRSTRGTTQIGPPTPPKIRKLSNVPCSAPTICGTLGSARTGRGLATNSAPSATRAAGCPRRHPRRRRLRRRLRLRLLCRPQHRLSRRSRRCIFR